MWTEMQEPSDSKHSEHEIIIALQVISDWISHFPLSSLAENNNRSSEHQVKSFEHLFWKPICKEI